jgi:hypothetical protein
MTLLNYNEETGFFTNKISRGRVSAGELAGTISSGGYVQIKIDDNSFFIFVVSLIDMINLIKQALNSFNRFARKDCFNACIFSK